MANYCQIVVVDDDKEDHLILRQYFEESGSIDKVCFLDNGQEAVAFLDSIEADKHLPNLVVLDLKMPILNGTQTLQKMKQSPRFKNIPVIIFSTSENATEKAKCLSLGAIDYIVKPATIKQGELIVKKFSSFIKP